MAEGFRRRRQAAGVIRWRLCLLYFFLNSSAEDLNNLKINTAISQISDAIQTEIDILLL